MREAPQGRSRLFGVVALLVALFFSLPAAAQEVINSFHSDIVLAADGTVDVTETIAVTSEGIEIRRGIYRDIPTTLSNPDGSKLRSDLEVISVTRDGSPEPYAVESLTTDIQRIRIGQADVFLSSGRHTYVVHYTMSRMGRFFEDHDELYWNATGNYWNFPILDASASVTLPEGAVISNLAAFTGSVGSRDQNASIQKTSPNTASFYAATRLQPGEGMTIAAAFQKGILVQPTGAAAGANWVSDHRDTIFPLLAVILVLAYNFLAWSAVGRDPAKGTIIPLFYPPEGFSPALVHYVHRMGWRNSGWTAFTSAIFNLGAKGLLTVDNTGKNLRLTVTNKSAEALPPGEAVIYKYVRGKGTVEIDKSNGAAIAARKSDFTRALESENRSVYFNNNGLYVFGGIALSALLLLALVVFDVVDPFFLVFAFMFGIIAGIAISVIPRFWSGNIVSKIILLVWVVIFGGNLLGAFAEFSTGLKLDTGLMASASIVLVNVIFAVLMRAPTVQGRKVMDQIDGFKMYLETAEKNRLNFEGVPKMTVSRFESLLPFAIALGVEKPWSEHFESELARNAVEDAGVGYHPVWYTGRDWQSGGLSRTVAAATSGMAAAMIAAQPASSSSSGFSGGGGSSGGGGGGGGGGGW